MSVSPGASGCSLGQWLSADTGSPDSRPTPPLHATPSHQSQTRARKKAHSTLGGSEPPHPRDPRGPGFHGHGENQPLVVGSFSSIPRTAKEPGKSNSNDHHPIVCSTRYAKDAQTTAKPQSPPRSLVRHCRRRQPRAAQEDTKAQGHVTGQDHKARKGPSRDMHPGPEASKAPSFHF